ncbi:MAG TPA: type I restriction endonuclease, partial [Spirochaetota bacterium]|nr:type I restriction endonuclease [Spirochaetota bacterium]
MNLFTEDILEQAALSWFESLGYSVIFGPDIAHDGQSPERGNYGEVILEARLHDALMRINKKVPSSAIDDAIRRILITESPSLIINNRSFHKMITDGIDVQYNRPDGTVKTDKVYLFDFENPDNNDWAVINQFTVIENSINRRPDIIIFLNGIPLVLFELKSASNEETDIQKAFHQIETYIKEISSIFIYNSFCVISDGLLAKAGTMTSNFERFMSWRTEDGDSILSMDEPQLETLIKGIFDKRRFLDIIKNFILFQDDSGTVTKILAGYHQYHAVNKAIDNTDKALGAKIDRRIG